MYPIASTSTSQSVGSVLLDGRDITGLRPDRINRLGVAHTFQKLKPFLDLTVTENVIVGALGYENRSRPSLRRKGGPEAGGSATGLQPPAPGLLCIAAGDGVTVRLIAAIVQGGSTPAIPSYDG